MLHMSLDLYFLLQIYLHLTLSILYYNFLWMSYLSYQSLRFLTAELVSDSPVFFTVIPVNTY